MGEGPNLSFLADLAGLCKQEVKGKSELSSVLPTEALKTAPQQRLEGLIDLRHLRKSGQPLVSRLQ